MSIKLGNITLLKIKNKKKSNDEIIELDEFGFETRKREKKKSYDSNRPKSMMIPQQYKICIMGGGGVGKSCITIQFIQHTYDDEYRPTIEGEFNTSRKIDVGDGERKAEIHITDTAGQEDYKALRIGNFRGKDGFIIVFDITQKSTFEELGDYYQDVILANNNDTNINGILVGNKSDLAYIRKVSIEEAKDLAERWGMSYIETSALKRTNIDEAFIYLVQKIRMNRKEKNLKFILNKSEKKKKEKLIKKDKEVIKQKKVDSNICDETMSPRYKGGVLGFFKIKKKKDDKKRRKKRMSLFSRKDSKRRFSFTGSFKNLRLKK